MTERKKVVPTGGRATAELRHPLETALDLPRAVVTLPFKIAREIVTVLRG